VNAYIRNQEEHHRTRSFDDEYLMLLGKAGAQVNAEEALG